MADFINFLMIYATSAVIRRGFDNFKYYFQNTSSTYDAGIVYGIKSLLNGYPKAFERLGFSLESNLIIDFFIYFIIIAYKIRDIVIGCFSNFFYITFIFCDFLTNIF